MVGDEQVEIDEGMVGPGEGVNLSTVMSLKLVKNGV